MTQLRFDGKVVLVTGAGRGAGRSHSLSLASRGARVVVADPGVAIDGSGFSAGPADDVVSEIRAAGGGQVMRMGFKQNQGLTSASLTVEEIAENIARIVDVDEAADVEVGMVSRG